ncbi:MAG: hypothetical protein NTV16_05330 [Actinobacteria bacterium]|nr:hypothetical protein [Actinomycetota bacterium]
MQLSRIVDGKKFLWDGSTYNDEKSAFEISQKYESDGFETKVINEEDKYFVFSRRIVKEIIVEGQPI